MKKICNLNSICKMAKNTNRYIKCTKYTLNNKKHLLKRTIYKSSVSAGSNLIVETNKHDPKIIDSNELWHHTCMYINEAIASYVLSSVIFLSIDMCKEFIRCNKEECKIDE